jgi:hypothetical protein
MDGSPSIFFVRYISLLKLQYDSVIKIVVMNEEGSDSYMDKTLIDIRYYASNALNEIGQDLPSKCSGFFGFPESLYHWGIRIATLLSAKGFSIGEFDHLYINYTNAIHKGRMIFSQRTPANWLRYIDYGVNFEDLDSLKEPELEQFVIQSTFECLEYLCHFSIEKSDIIKWAATEIDKFATEVELPVKAKENKSYSVFISYKLRPQGASSYGIVKYINHKTGLIFSERFVDLKDPSDIFPLIGTISVKNEKILIKARPSFRASLHTNAYQVPFEIEIKKQPANNKPSEIF